MIPGKKLFKILQQSLFLLVLVDHSTGNSKLEQKNCCFSYVDTVVTLKLTKPWKPEVIIIVWIVIGVQGKTD